MRLSAAILLTIILAAAVKAGEAKTTVPSWWRSGVGTSTLADPAAAGEEAAARAKEGLDGKPARLVIAIAAATQFGDAFLAGVARHFPADLVYGCQVTSPLTPDSNFSDYGTIDIPAGAAVWALGGDMELTIETVATAIDADDAYYYAGAALAEALRPAMEALAGRGRLLLTFGDQYNGSNKDFAYGLNDGFGETYPIIGAAAGNITAKVAVRGKILTGVNVGIVLGGDFVVGQAMNGGTHTPETADRTLAEALAGGGGGDPFFAFVFNCRRRRQGMIERGQLADELAAIRKNLPATDFFGFYGPGEIGAKASGEEAEGVGFTVVAAVLFATESGSGAPGPVDREDSRPAKAF